MNQHLGASLSASLTVRTWTASVLAATMLFAAASAFAQEEEGVKPAHKAKAAAPAGGAKKGADKAAPAEVPTDADLDQSKTPDPGVEAILAAKPTTPPECSRAAKILADLQRPDLAKKFLQDVLNAKLSDRQLAELGNKFGPKMFDEMAAQEALCPEARQLADAVMAATNKQLQDPNRVADLLKKLQDPSQEVRAGAMAGLKESREAGVDALVAVLADHAREAEHPTARAALLEMGPEAVGPMMGLLDGADVELKVNAIKILTDLRAPDTALFLLAPYTAADSDPRVRAAADAALIRLVGRAPAKADALQALLKQATVYFQQRQPIRGQLDGHVQLWRWDAEKKSCVAEKLSVEDASRTLAARLARDAFAIAPDDRQARLLYLATMLEEAAYRHGLDKPIDVDKDPAALKAAHFGVAAISELLQYCLSKNHSGAAVVAAQLLGKIGKADDVLRQGAQPSPLVQAASDPNRRVRMAAVEAIVRLQPAGPYAGSSHVLESLSFLAGSSGARRALIACPQIDAQQEMAELLAVMGYQTDLAGNGRQAIRKALASPDYEVAYIDTTIDDPPIELLVQQLRHDCRTARLLVGVSARSGRIEQAERIAREDPFCMAFSRPHTYDVMLWQLGQLGTLAPHDFVTFPERQAEAARALECLATLADSSGKVYDMYRAQDAVLAALAVPALSARAAAVLAHLGTPESQRALVDLASRYSRPLEARRAAVKAFCRNVAKFRVLLSAAEIRRQYDRYNRSASQDVATQRILGAILDCIEGPASPAKTAAPAKAAAPGKALNKDDKASKKPSRS